MPSALSIRKQLLQSLDRQLLPAFENKRYPNLVLTEFPIYSTEAIEVTHCPGPLLVNRPTGMLQNWPEERLNAAPYPILIMVFEGAVDIRIGMTERMARNLSPLDEWAQSGYHVLHLTAPTCLFIPPDVPFSDGSSVHWESPDLPPPQSRLFWLDQRPGGLICHMCETEQCVHLSSYSLKIVDSDVMTLMNLLNGEVARRGAASKTIACSYLTALLQCLQRRLAQDVPVIANTVHLPLPEPLRDGQSSPTDRIVKLADEFVHNHLGESITLPQLASYCGVSPTHLNRVFQARMGMSAKRFIYRQRVLSAQKILRDCDLPIKEVASLVGFLHASHFCRVFQRVVGTSPTEFRLERKE